MPKSFRLKAQYRKYRLFYHRTGKYTVSDVVSTFQPGSFTGRRNEGVKLLNNSLHRVCLSCVSQHIDACRNGEAIIIQYDVVIRCVVLWDDDDELMLNVLRCHLTY